MLRIIFVCLALIVCLYGYGTLTDIVSNPQSFISGAEGDISGVEVLIPTGVPYSQGISLALGYGLALLRRWYKDKKKS